MSIYFMCIWKSYLLKYGTQLQQLELLMQTFLEITTQLLKQMEYSVLLNICFEKKLREKLFEIYVVFSKCLCQVLLTCFLKESLRNPNQRWWLMMAVYLKNNL